MWIASAAPSEAAVCGLVIQTDSWKMTTKMVVSVFGVAARRKCSAASVAPRLRLTCGATGPFDVETLEIPVEVAKVAMPRLLAR